MSDFSNHALTHYNWEYAFEPNIIGTVLFQPIGHLALHAGPGANSMGTSWKPVDNDPNAITTTLLMSTKMLPPPEVQAREKIFAMTFSNQEKLHFDLDETNPEAPVLTIGGHDKLRLTGVMEPSRRWGVQPTRKFYDIHPDSTSPSHFKMREVTYDEDYIKATLGDWKPYPAGYIEGMKWEFDPNTEIRIRVNEYIVNGVVKQCLHDMVVQSKMI